MKVTKLSDMHRGWYVGDFTPAVLRTDRFEVGIITRLKDEVHPKHYHKESTEINCLIKGKMILNGQQLEPGDIFTLDPMEVADAQFLEDCTIVVARTASVPGDKYVQE